MNKVIIGVDPDADKHGVAIYKNGKLMSLHSWRLTDFIGHAVATHDLTTEISQEFVIEDVCANKFVYARNSLGNKSVTSKIAMAVGRCQQSQVELMRILDLYGIRYKLIKPTKGNWAKNKSQFEKVTGWTGRSNEDTRSAAWFGYLGVTK